MHQLSCLCATSPPCLVRRHSSRTTRARITRDENEPSLCSYVRSLTSHACAAATVARSSSTQGLLAQTSLSSMGLATALWGCVSVVTGAGLLATNRHFRLPLCAAMSANFWLAVSWISWVVSPVLAATLAWAAFSLRGSVLLFAGGYTVLRRSPACVHSYLHRREDSRPALMYGCVPRVRCSAAQMDPLDTLFSMPSG
jgi:hypothetical protein